MKNLIKFNPIRGLILIVAGLLAVNYFGSIYLENYLDTSIANMPKVHLALSEKAIAKNNMKGSYEELSLAINSMTSIESYSDSVATFYIEKSISELEFLKKEIIKNEVVVSDFNHAYFDAYIAMAYATLRLSEVELIYEKHSLAFDHFKNSFSYVKASQKYTNENNIEAEKKVLAEMREIMIILKNHEDIELDFNQINSELELLMESY